MSAGYRELDGITADVGIEASGEDLETAFANAALGLSSLLADLHQSTLDRTEHLTIRGDTLEELLVRFLNEIIYLEETGGFLPGRVTRLDIKGTGLTATLDGVTYDPAVHTTEVQVKAATYHDLEIDPTGEGVRIKVIFDV